LFGGKWAVGTPGRDGMPFRGDSNTHAVEIPRSRAHTKAEISRLENNFGCLGKLVNGLPRSKLLFNTLPDEAVVTITGVKMARFAHVDIIDRVLKSKSSKFFISHKMLSCI